jgi:hypothetical protein
VTSLPSTVSVISALRAEVDENDRRRLFRQSEQAKRVNQPFDVGRDAAETNLSIL